MYHKIMTPAAAQKAAATAVETRSKELRKIGTILIIVGVVLIGLSLLLLHPALLTIPLSIAITPLVDSKEVNKPGGTTVRNNSTFPMNYKFFDTYQFGKIKPCFVMRSQPDDHIRLHSGHDVRSYTLASPLMQNIRMHKAHFNVPLQAILPFNHDKFIVNPTIGEDIPDDVGCTVKDFLSKWYQFLIPIFGKVANMNASDINEYLRDIFLLYVYTSYVYSNGSLLASLGCHYSPALSIELKDGSRISLDMFWEQVFANFESSGLRFTMDVGSEGLVEVRFGDVSAEAYKDNGARLVSFKEFISDFVFDEVPNITSVWMTNQPQTGWLEILKNNFRPNTLLAGYTDSIATDSEDDSSAFYFMVIPDTEEEEKKSNELNLERLWAYQLVCAHFFSNDKIDYIFSADLFRQLVGSYILDTVGLDDFIVNGMKYNYDYMSSHNFSSILDGFSYYNINVFGFFSALFSYKNSLKFMDYFSGAKTRPFAVGDVLVNPTGAGGTISVIDLSKTSWMAKFLQTVNRFGSKFENYIEGIFGKRPAYDYHNPMFLAETQDVIYSTETENTGEAQMSLSDPMPITSQLRSNGDRFAFEFDADRFGVLISVVYFDIERVYCETVEREFFDLDRFDYFNPYGQFVGDQPIYQGELKGGYGDSPFGYTGRYMNLKQRYSQASGGFVEFLPSWLFLADRHSPLVLKPRAIRSHPSEMDRFYKSLTHNTLAGYFHFIIANDNDCSANRAMAFNPTINL